MNHTTASTSGVQKTYSLNEIDRVIKQLSKLMPKDYTLLCPDGRVLKDADPWKLAALSGELPAILKTPLPDEADKGGAP